MDLQDQKVLLENVLELVKETRQELFLAMHRQKKLDNSKHMKLQLRQQQQDILDTEFIKIIKRTQRLLSIKNALVFR